MTQHNGKEDQVIRLGEVLEELDLTASFEDRQQHIKNMLARYLNLKTVVALIGTGASIPLGYPSWKEFTEDTLESAIETIKASKSEADVSNISTLKKYQDYLNDARRNELSAQVMLAECERFWREYIERQPETVNGDKPVSFRKYIQEAFIKVHNKFLDDDDDTSNKVPVTYQDKLDAKHNPYLALLELPIRRFITTNYDLEIERAILIKKHPAHWWKDNKQGNATKDDIIKWTKGTSFSPEKKYCDELAKFPLARYEGNRNMVFHCHGRIDEINSCIITETDYQQWYLRDDPDSMPFRQALDLTLSSNPILIIGYGLGDVDLMRWLRMITANRPKEKIRNPLFCLNYISQSHWMDERSRDLIKAECDALYLKYGLHVIPVLEEETFSGYPNTALCHALTEIAGRWRDWWDGLSLKPNFRATPKDNQRDTGYYHYEIDFDNSKHPIPSIQEKLKVKLEKQIDSLMNERPGLAVVVGDGGAGKSWSVQKYLKDKEDKYKSEGKESKFIFWSSYYANDVLTGIDRLIEYLSRPGITGTGVRRAKSKGQSDTVDQNGAAEDRFEQLICLLRAQKRKHVVIVFDGIEKLLAPDSNITDGRSISPEVEKFFRIISDNFTDGKKKKRRIPADRQFSCNIILTTRLFPLDILPAFDKTLSKEANQAIQQKMRKEVEIIATRCWKEDLLGERKGTKVDGKKVNLPGIDTFRNLYRDEPEKRKVKTSSLCSLVDGHVFCIALIRGILEDFIQADEEIERAESFSPQPQTSRRAEAKFEKLERDIANTPIDRRVYRVIREVIKHLDSNEDYVSEGGIVEKFVERISLFMHPVRREVAWVCYKEAEKIIGIRKPDNPENEDERTKLGLSKLLVKLVQKNLLQQVFLKGKNEPGYVVHPLVRNFVHQTLHKSLFTSVPSLQLSGITTMEVVDPGTEETGVAVTKSLFETLCVDAAKPYNRSKGGIPNPPSEEEKRISSDLCRGAFSILRSRFSANTVTRWGDYRDYLQLVVKLYDTAKLVSEDRWMHHEPTSDGNNLTRSHDKPAPLYADEVAWVYNEIGLTSISMGHILNAIPFREQGLEISRLIDNNRDGRYLFQAQFNLSTAYMFLGRLSFAMEYLKKAFVIGNKLRDKELISRTKAYIAYIKYLQGSLEEADKDFNDSYSGIESNPRARGVFYCYHGEVLLKLGKKDEAKVKIDQSRHIGEAEFYPDLIAHARLANANFLVREGEYEKAQNEYSFVLKEATKTRLRRLQTGTLSGMSRLANKLNDSEVAKQRAIESLKISNEYALCLHQTIGMIVLGTALVKEGIQRDLGIACLRTARDMANSQGYFLRKNEAEQALQELKVE